MLMEWLFVPIKHKTKKLCHLKLEGSFGIVQRREHGRTDGLAKKVVFREFFSTANPRGLLLLLKHTIRRSGLPLHSQVFNVIQKSLEMMG